MCVIVQVESVRALKNIDEIAAVDGVDAVFIGPSDLSASLGYGGDVSHPDVVSAVSDALRRIRRADKFAGHAILATIAGQPDIEARTVKDATNYLLDFFDNLKKPEDFKREMGYACRG
jgi:2-keto-3-deoxy-L-rhamnonate aldolase RhmA